MLELPTGSSALDLGAFLGSEMDRLPFTPMHIVHLMASPFVGGAARQAGIPVVAIARGWTAAAAQDEELPWI
jgi:hypothetical protein